MGVPNYKDIKDLVEKGLTTEAKEKIMELREYALTLQEENLALKKRVGDLEAEVRKKQNMQHARSLYYAIGDGVPYCPQCWEGGNLAIHLFRIEMSGDSEGWACHACNHDYYAKKGGPFSAELNMR